MTNKNSTPETQEVQILDDLTTDQMSSKRLRAVNALVTAKVPKEHLRQHPGKGGKIFTYVPHTIATDTMNDAFGMAWNWEIVETNLYPDKSATARGTLSLIFYDKSGNLRERKITEVGGFEGKGDGMSSANIVLGACSRALLRCMLRAFGYGRELYKDDEKEMTEAQAWGVLKAYAKTKKVSEEVLIQAIKEAGISSDMLVDKFEDAYALVAELAKNPPPETPKEEKPKKEKVDKAEDEDPKEINAAARKEIRQELVKYAVEKGIMKDNKDAEGGEQIKSKVMAKVNHLRHATPDNKTDILKQAKSLIDKLAEAKKPKK